MRNKIQSRLVTIAIALALMLFQNVGLLTRTVTVLDHDMMKQRDFTVIPVLDMMSKNRVGALFHTMFGSNHTFISDAIFEEESNLLPSARTQERKTEQIRSLDGPKLTRNYNVSIPNVLLAGVQKGGTSSAWEYLKRTQGPLDNFCPSLTLPGRHETPKEAHFFDRYDFDRPLLDDDNGLSDVELYAKRFDQQCVENATRSLVHGRSTKPLVFIDATPNYMYYPEQVRKLYDEQGAAEELRIIFILREPVAREQSWYNHKLRDYKRHPKKAPDWQRHGVVKNGTDAMMSFEESMNNTVLLDLQKGDVRQYQLDNPQSLQGLYAPLLERWFSLFSRQQIIVLSFDEMKASPVEFQHRLDLFLGLDDGEVKKDSTIRMPKMNRARKRDKFPAPSCNILEHLRARFRPHNDMLYNLLEQNPGPSMEQSPYPKFRELHKNC